MDRREERLLKKIDVGSVVLLDESLFLTSHEHFLLKKNYVLEKNYYFRDFNHF